MSFILYKVLASNYRHVIDLMLKNVDLLPIKLFNAKHLFLEALYLSILGFYFSV